MPDFTVKILIFSVTNLCWAPHVTNLIHVWLQMTILESNFYQQKMTKKGQIISMQITCQWVNKINILTALCIFLNIFFYMGSIRMNVKADWSLVGCEMFYTLASVHIRVLPTVMRSYFMCILIHVWDIYTPHVQMCWYAPSMNCFDVLFHNCSQPINENMHTPFFRVSTPRESL